MTAIIIFFVLIIGLNFIPDLTKKSYPKTEKVVSRLLIITISLFLTFAILKLYGYRLKGIHTFSVIGLIFIVSTILFFAILKNNKKKLIITIIHTPILFLSILILLIGRVVYEQKIDSNHKISVTNGGILGCGEMLFISQSRFVIFDNQIVSIENLCLKGIYNIDVIKLNEKQIEFLIYHMGKHPTENPLKYTVDRKDIW
jgi:hypothetical protein